MNKFFIFAVALMLLLSLSSVAIAKVQHNNILLKRIVIIEDSSTIITSIIIKNNNNFDFDNGKVVVSIPQLGLRVSKRINIDDGSKRTVRVLLVGDIAPGDYYLRIVVSNEDVKRVRHRLITIQ